MESKLQDLEYLRLALAQAELRRGFCAPNPAVGCVVVKDNMVVAQGFHAAAGKPHAEVEALSKCGEEARGATLYVTLEPCCMWGRTPPCTDLIETRGLKRVVYGQVDPDPRVQGQGADRLNNKAGIICEHIPTPEITAFYESYRYWHQFKLPFVTAKLALTLDGKISAANKTPIHFTGPKVDEVTHRLRNRSDALLSTASTVNFDNPRLNVRIGQETLAKPVYVLDRKQSIHPNAQIFKTASKVIRFYDGALGQSNQPNVRPIVCREEQLDWSQIFKSIGEDGVQDLWVEAGGTCVQSLLHSNFLKKLYLYVAPVWLGAEAQSAFSNSVNELFSSARSLTWTSYGKDAVCELNW